MPLSYSLFFFLFNFFLGHFCFFSWNLFILHFFTFRLVKHFVFVEKNKEQKTKAKQTKQNKNIQKAFFSSLAKPLKMLKVVAIFQTEFQTKAKARSVLRASIINFQFTAQLKIRLSKETYMQTC